MDIFEQMCTRWPSNIIARSEIKKFSGGAFSPKSLANRDSQGTGPEGRFILGRRVVYPASSLTNWLRQNVKDVIDKTPKDPKVHCEPHDTTSTLNDD